MKTKAIATIAVAVVAMMIFAVAGATTYSWFTDSESSEINISTAIVDIDTELGGDFSESSSTIVNYNRITPGWKYSDVDVEYKVINNSNVDSAVRTLLNISITNADGAIPEDSILADLEENMTVYFDDEKYGVKNGTFVLVNWYVESFSEEKYNKGEMPTHSYDFNIETTSDLEAQNVKINIKIETEVIQANAMDFAVVNGDAVSGLKVPGAYETDAKVDVEFTNFNKSVSGDEYLFVYADSVDGFGSASARFNFTLQNGSTFDSAKVMITVPGDASSGTVIYIGNDTQPTSISADYDSSNDVTVIEFTTTHFSEFFVYDGHVSDVNGLVAIAEMIDNEIKGVNVTLDSDIDLSGIDWTPIGGRDTGKVINNNKVYTQFTGSFNGNGKKISNLSVSVDGVAGLFGKINGGAIVSDLIIENARVSGGAGVAAVVGNGGTSSEISNVSVIGEVLICGKDYVGGILGTGYTDISKCSVKGTADSHVNISAVPYLVSDSKYDGGAKVGGIAGVVGNKAVRSCVVEYADLKAYRDIGSVIGMAQSENYSVTVDSNEARHISLLVDQVTGYYGDETVNVGNIVGRQNISNATENNNSSENISIIGYVKTIAGFDKCVIGGIKNITLASGKYNFEGKGSINNISLSGTVDGKELCTELIFSTKSHSGTSNYENVTFNNLKLIWANELYSGLKHSKGLIYNSCEIIGQPFLYAVDEVFNNCLFTQTSPDAYNVWTYGAGSVVFNECIFNSAGKSVLIYTESGNGQNVTFNKVKFNASTSVSGKAAVEIDSSLLSTDGAYDIHINNSTASGFDKGSVSGLELWNEKKGEKSNIFVNDIEQLTKQALKKVLQSDEKEICISLTNNTSYDISANVESYYLGGPTTEKIVIDGNGFTLSFNHKNSDWNYIRCVNDDCEIVMSDVNLTNAGYNNGPWNRHDIRFFNDCELTDVSSDKAIALFGDSILTRVAISDAHVDNSDAYLLWIVANGQDVIISDCDFVVNKSKTGDRGIKIADEYVKTPAKVSLTVDGSKFVTQKKGAILVTNVAGAYIVWGQNNDISEVDADDTTPVWVDEDRSDSYDLVNVIGTSKYLEGSIIKEVTDVESLKSVLSDAGSAGAGYTFISISADINMNGEEWEPIKVDGYHGADIVTIEGNGFKIYNLSAPLFAGGFAGGSGIVIKDLTIDDSNIISTNTIGSGAFIESVDSMDTITMINCHLLNSTVTGGNGSRTGGLIGWTAGYSNVNDGPVKTYVTIKNCSVIGCTITCNGSVGGINGHAGNNDWTYTTIENCTVKDCKLISTDDGGWRVGVVVGTANVGEVTISGITEEGNTLSQAGKTAPAGQSNFYGRFVPGSTGKLTIDGVQI